MIYVRGEKFRAVDGHDQLQLGKRKMAYVCKKKAWTKLLMGLFEILIVNINILKKSSGDKTTGDVFRWKLVMSMVKKAQDMKTDDGPVSNTPRRSL